MAYPEKPDVAYSYSDFQEASPSTPLPANQVDDDFADHKVAIDAIIDFLQTTCESNGKVKVGALPNSTDLTAATTAAAASASAAATSATAAATSATSASSSATAASNAAGGFAATSTSSVAIGTGSKSFTIQTAKLFAVGQFVVVAETAAPSTNYMHGQVTAYNSGTGALTVNVGTVGGSGTINAWTVSLSGPVGATGSTGATGAAGSGGTDATGVVKYWHGRYGDIPAGWLAMNGASGLARASYTDLVALLIKSSTFTVTIATPAVITKNSHGLDSGDPWVPTTDGALPTGLTAGNTYYVTKIDANTFKVSSSLANFQAGTFVNTTGSQSGTHTYVSALCGVGDGSTTFDAPDWRGVQPIGHDVMGNSAASLLTFAGSGIYGNVRNIQGAQNDDVTNGEHSHSYGSARAASSATAVTSVEGAPTDTFLKSIDNAGSGTTGSQGTASQKYKRVGRVAPGYWIIKT